MNICIFPFALQADSMKCRSTFPPAACSLNPLIGLESVHNTADCFAMLQTKKKTYLLVNNLEETEKLMKLLLNTIWQTTKSPNIETCTTVCSCDCPPATHSHHTSNVTCAQFFHLNNIKKSFNFLNHKQIRITNISAKTAAVVKCKIRGGGMLHSGLGPCQW